MTAFVLGIAGGSASGKSHLAQRLVRHFGPMRCAHIAHDDYYRPLPPDFAHRPGDYNFDSPEALETDLLVAHLHQLRGGHAVEVPRYHFGTHDRVGAQPVAPRPLVIVEGILLFTHPELVDLLDLRVFVDAPAPVRLRRRIVRDVAERQREPAWVEERFARHVEPMHQVHVEPSRHVAHLLVDGQAPIDGSVHAVLARLPATLRDHPTKER